MPRQTLSSLLMNFGWEVCACHIILEAAEDSVTFNEEPSTLEWKKTDPPSWMEKARGAVWALRTTSAPFLQSHLQVQNGSPNSQSESNRPICALLWPGSPIKHVIKCCSRAVLRGIHHAGTAPAITPQITAFRIQANKSEGWQTAKYGLRCYHCWQ